MQSVLQGNLFLTIRRVPEMGQLAEAFFCLKYASESLWYEIKASACSGLSIILPNRRIPF